MNYDDRLINSEVKVGKLLGEILNYYWQNNI